MESEGLDEYKIGLYIKSWNDKKVKEVVLIKYVHKWAL